MSEANIKLLAGKKADRNGDIAYEQAFVRRFNLPRRSLKDMRLKSP